jgi:hypothetical protein
MSAVVEGAGELGAEGGVNVHAYAQKTVALSLSKGGY